MDAKTQLKYLRVINYLNFNTNFIENSTPEQDANFALASAMREFIANYEFEIRKKYTFVIKYDNDIFSFLALRVCHAAAIAMNTTIDIRILGELTSEEKEFLKDFKTICYRKAKKLKQCVLITGFNPIVNVEFDRNLYKDFVNIHNPIAKISNSNLKTLKSFYLNEKDKLYTDDLQPSNWDCFYYKPIGMADILQDKSLTWEISPDDIEQKCDKTIPVIAFKVSGTEKDFDTYDIIYKSSKEGNIHLYIIENGEEGLNFVKTNLTPYLNSRNVPQEINIITEERALEFYDLMNNDEETFKSITYEDVERFGVDAVLEVLEQEDNEG